MGTERSLHILLVEDEQTDAELIRRTLQRRFSIPFELIHAPDLATARTLVAAGAPDLIVLDLSLPDSSGLETFRNLHAAAADTPIVVLSGYDDEEIAADAVGLGAQDYLVKSSLDANVLTRALRFALERAKRQAAERDLEHVRNQVELIRSVQERLFPPSPLHLDGYEIAGAVHSAEAASGDYFDFIPMPDGSVGLVVGDVSGHGLGSSLLMAETHAYLQALADACTPVDEILTRCNRFIFRDCPEDHFVTLFFARLIPGQRHLEFAAAGHAAYRMTQDGNVHRLQATGLPLGLIEHARIPAAESVDLEAGEILLIPTDGIQEARTSEEELFGLERMWDVVQQSRHAPAMEIIGQLCDSARSFSHPRPPQDDMTAVIVKVLGDDPDMATTR
ncbi:Phosphoserine phosphatase RsbU [Maioricimonas rarisocia]|uniref:Phosphoserine phosphatase RsbU n=1 Tax=Maioricimonas rarisocia TaxID=2528026 RepID=A0A517Z600_9PLAN|nr:fused response regulator/phosphatase [Maioricimonas rarisocia]QDU37903.1 Phosphoserine phosphatase RsbU [Maioricimonas rarisocia]